MPLSRLFSQSNLAIALLRVAVVLLLGLPGTGCKRHASAAETRSSQSIQNIGSDTMVNLAQAWAEEYSTVVPTISVEVSGGGSGVGVAALINGTADVANSSRHLEAEEIEKAKRLTGKVPKEFLVGFDGLAIFVHRNNPLDEISVDELSELYRENGTIENWSQLGVREIPGAKRDRIVRVSRQNNSGTYHYFRETVVGKKNDFKHGSLDMNGSKEVVELVGRTPGSIGYSGVGYATPAVKVLRVSPKRGMPAIKPTNETILDKSYPVARPMFFYTPGEPKAHVQKYLDWVLSDAGQKIVERTGYVPLARN